MKRKPTRKSGANSGGEKTTKQDRAEPKLDPHQGHLVKAWNKLTKKMGKKDETSEFQLSEPYPFDLPWEAR